MTISLRRRDLLGAAAAGATMASSLRAGTPALPAGDGPLQPDLFIGTGGHGHTYPGATLPFGMVQLSPDTDNERWDACSGYHRDDTSIMGFSHTHLSGTGIGDMLDVLVVPTRGKLELEPGPLDNPDAGYRQRFSGEHAEPGYYRVQLESGLLAELTTTERTGLHRYTFPAGPAHILIDLAHLKKEAPGEPVLIDKASLNWDGETLTGSRQVFRWAKGRHIHFALQLSRKPDRIAFFGDDNRPAGETQVSGRRLKVALFFDDAGAQPIVLRTGISGVDVKGAQASLADEVHGWDFDRYRRAATARWHDHLGMLRVEGGSADQRTIMASALYHSLLAPTQFTDSDGRYQGMDGAIHKAPADQPAFSSYSLWDTYRALHPLMTLIAPDKAHQFTQDLIRQATQSRFGPSVWPLQGVETGCMIGWHAVVVMAEAITKGIPGDYAAAWPAIRKRAFDPTAPDQDNSLGRDYYDSRGWIPADKIFESVSRTLEYAYDDHAMAVIAEKVGAHDDAATLRKRALNYAHLFDAQRGFMRPRLDNGLFAEPYDPVALGHSSQWRDFTESNGWQATFLNQHDIYGLIALFGGAERFAAQLDALFNAPSVLPANAPPDISGLVGQYAHGNEPSHHVAYLYAYTGAAWKTQAMVRRLCVEMYKNDPDGIIGNDDCGQMSAWFVLSALGFYPVDPVSGVYVFGSPLFDRVEVQLGQGGARLLVEARGNAPDAPYIQSVEWRGQPWSRGWISHEELRKGGKLVFRMGAKPNKDFASALEDRPPSFGRNPV